MYSSSCLEANFKLVKVKITVYSKLVEKESMKDGLPIFDITESIFVVRFEVSGTNKE